jgi:hypothetical protein
MGMAKQLAMSETKGVVYPHPPQNGDVLYSGLAASCPSPSIDPVPFLKPMSLPFLYLKPVSLSVFYQLSCPPFLSHPSGYPPVDSSSFVFLLESLPFFCSLSNCVSF